MTLFLMTINTLLSNRHLGIGNKYINWLVLVFGLVLN